MAQLGEFELIGRYFTRAGAGRADVVLGVGDDAAILRPAAGLDLVAATDTLVAGTHFEPDTAPAAIGHKALAVNLSDVAAMGAEPRWALLALTVPAAEAAWLEDFAAGLYTLADAHGVAVVGGDTTRGPLAVTVTVLGTVEPGTALRRDGARPGDAVLVTGTLGDAALALALRGRGQTPEPALLERLQRPQPRLAAGRSLRGVASSAIDVSDGLAADLGHVLEASRVGAVLDLDRLPLSAALRARPPGQAAGLALNGGDDYELCFTVAAAREAEALARLSGAGVPATRIGTIEAGPGLVLQGRAAAALPAASSGYRHF